jgi:hypothetical protein
MSILLWHMAGPSYPERRASRLFQLQYGAPLCLSRLSPESADEPTLLDLIEQTIEHTPRKRCMRAALKREPDLRCIIFGIVATSIGSGKVKGLS